MHIKEPRVSARPSSSSTAVAHAEENVASSSAEVEGTRRRFKLGYKRKIVTLAADLPSGEIGVLLRHEGFYSSHLTHWLQLIATLDSQAAEPTRGRKPDPLRSERLALEKLERENARLQRVVRVSDVPSARLHLPWLS